MTIWKWLHVGNKKASQSLSEAVGGTNSRSVKISVEKLMGNNSRYLEIFSGIKYQTTYHGGGGIKMY